MRHASICRMVGIEHKHHHTKTRRQKRRELDDICSCKQEVTRSLRPGITVLLLKDLSVKERQCYAVHERILFPHEEWHKWNAVPFRRARPFRSAYRLHQICFSVSCGREEHRRSSQKLCASLLQLLPGSSPRPSSCGGVPALGASPHHQDCRP